MAVSDRPTDANWMQEIELSAGKDGSCIKVRRESGWLPKEYVRMLNETIEKGYLLGYRLYADGVVADRNGNGARDGNETKMARPVAIGRKTDGTYCVLVYETTDEGDPEGFPFINLLKYNSADALGQDVRSATGIVRTNWPKLERAGRVHKNPLVRVRTNTGTKEVFVPYVIEHDGSATAVLDPELKAYLERCDALPKNFEVLER